MMRDSVKEFVDKELHTKIVLKRLCLYRGMYEKSRRFRSLGVAVPEAYGGLGMGFVSTVGLRLHFWCNRIFLNCFGAHTGRYYADNFIWY
jgi:hypothetical protein